MALQEATEYYLVSKFEDAQVAAIHGKRVTIMCGLPLYFIHILAHRDCCTHLSVSCYDLSVLRWPLGVRLWVTLKMPGL